MTPDGDPKREFEIEALGELVKKKTLRILNKQVYSQKCLRKRIGLKK